MDTVILEIRSAEGGEDSKLLVRDFLATYIKAGSRRGL
jgi:protein subunit release factor A